MSGRLSNDGFWLAFWALANAFFVWVSDAYLVLNLVNAGLAIACLWAFNDEISRT